MANLGSSVDSYGSNVRSLMEEHKKLKDEIDRVHLLVEAEERNQQVILPRVIRWLEAARQADEEINQFLTTEVAKVGNGCNPYLKLRNSVSGTAKEKTKSVVELIKRGGFPADQIAYPLIPPGWSPRYADLHGGSQIACPAYQNFLVLESIVMIMNKIRICGAGGVGKTTVMNIMEALKDDTINVIRICGAGGVGKTTVMNKIVNHVRQKNMFDEVATAVVSQTPDFKKIQDAIADQLGLKLEEESEMGRAAQLNARIVEINKFLLVLDDVCGELQFEKIGLPLGSGYKILFTSRRNDVSLTSGGIISEPINFEVPARNETDDPWSFEEMEENPVWFENWEH